MKYEILQPTNRNSLDDGNLHGVKWWCQMKAFYEKHTTALDLLSLLMVWGTFTIVWWVLWQ